MFMKNPPKPEGIPPWNLAQSTAPADFPIDVHSWREGAKAALGAMAGAMKDIVSDEMIAQYRADAAAALIPTRDGLMNQQKVSMSHYALFVASVQEAVEKYLDVDPMVASLSDIKTALDVALAEKKTSKKKG